MNVTAQLLKIKGVYMDILGFFILKFRKQAAWGDSFAYSICSPGYLVKYVQCVQKIFKRDSITLYLTSIQT